MLPRQPALHTLTSIVAHAPARLGIVEQCHNFRAKSVGSLRFAYSDASCADTRPSVRSNCTIGLPSAMYSMILFIVDLSFMSFAMSGLTHTSAVLSTASSSASGTRPVNVT